MRIELAEVSKVFGEGRAAVLALAPISLSIGPGDVLFVTGRSGSGKTTLLNVLGLLDRPSSGRYLLDGVEPAYGDEAALARVRRDRIGFIYQNSGLLPGLSAIDNALLPAMAAGRARGMKGRALALMARLGLAGLEGKRPDRLSGGERQRVAMARAMLKGAELVLADEPTGELDDESAAEAMALLRLACAERGAALVVVTHDVSLPAAGERRVDLGARKA